MLTLVDREINNLLKITYFREFFEICFKYVAYKHLYDNNKIYHSKNNELSNFKSFNLNKYKCLGEILNRFGREISNI